ncbi:hypothetical protein AAG570_005610 [Ranatra chinensis]|uniref:Helicase C-terminal domain-containing protein n=1 Tax=Ranatra chinensis TaxID=642074 RepID=A0ABD0XZL7_9HEMI
MVQILKILEEVMDLRGYKYEMLTGQHHLQKRKESINNFNTDPSVFAFLISTRAGGLGINLTAADTVIIYDSDWNPHADSQAQDRCHRIGQTKPVVIYRLVTTGTYDERIVLRANSKKKLEQMVLHKSKIVICFPSCIILFIHIAEYVQDILISKFLQKKQYISCVNFGV